MFLRVRAAVECISTVTHSCPDRVPQELVLLDHCFCKPSKGNTASAANCNTICLQGRARKANLKIKKSKMRLWLLNFRDGTFDP